MSLWLSRLWLLLALWFSCACYAGVYKWVDDRGVTHYSAQNPKSVSADEVSEQLQRASSVIKAFKREVNQSSPPLERTVVPEVEVIIETVNYSLSHAMRGRIDTQLNAMYRAYVQWLGWDARPVRPITIRLFGKFKDFEQFQRAHRDNVTHRSHYSSRHKEILMLGTEFGEATLSLLYHESSHAILDMRPGHYPKWINEGLAEVFAMSNSHEASIRLNYAAKWSQLMKHKLREGSLLSLEHYLALPNRAWGDESARVENSYYMISWALMRFLLSSEQGINSLRQIIAACRQQAWWQDDGLVKIFARHYPAGMQQLDADFRQWIQQH